MEINPQSPEIEGMTESPKGQHVMGFLLGSHGQKQARIALHYCEIISRI